MLCLSALLGLLSVFIHPYLPLPRIRHHVPPICLHATTLVFISVLFFFPFSFLSIFPLRSLRE